MPGLPDALAFPWSILAGGLLIVLPGWFLARRFRVGQGDVSPALAASVLGLALLPLIDSMTARIFGLDAALAFNLVLAACGVLVAARARSFRRHAPSLKTIILLAGWALLVFVESFDFEHNGVLYQPFTAIDLVKHVATTQAIVDTGAPPRDPFFLRPERVGYYYFFYSLPALVQRLGFGLTEARAAVAALIFWTGIGLYGLLRLSIANVRDSRLAKAGTDWLAIAILAAGGLDILGVLRLGLLQGTWLADPVAWNEQITGWTESLLWVPHHVVGLIAAVLGMLALSGLATLKEPPRRADAASIVLAALCLASAFGLSIWVSLALAGTLATWGLLLMWERRWWPLVAMGAVAGLAAILVLPQVLDLIDGRHPTGAAPILLAVRAFSPIEALDLTEPWRSLARLAVLPINYFAVFGVLASGSLLYWQRKSGEPRFATEFARLLAVSAIVGLAFGAFLKSTLINNDLGWRVTLFPLLAGTVWTVLGIRRVAARAEPRSRRLAVPVQITVMLVLGWTTTLYGLASLRAYPLLPVPAEHRFMAAHPATENALKTAYRWADANLPRGYVLQHDPTRPRAFAFAFYGHHPVGVSDQFGSIFGADPNDVTQRIMALAPIFQSAMPIEQIHDILTANGIDGLVVTRDDPVWTDKASFVWHVQPLYMSDAVRIVSSDSLARTSALNAPREKRREHTKND